MSQILRIIRPWAKARWIYSRILILLLALLTASVASWAQPFQYPSVGLDASWAQALVEATDSGRIFGRDILFTYGPLHQALTVQISDLLLPITLSKLLFSTIWFLAQLMIGLWLGLFAEVCVALAIVVSVGSSGDTSFYLLALVGILAPASLSLLSRHSSWLKLSTLSSVLIAGSLLSTLVKLSFLGSALPALAFGLWLHLTQAWRQRNWQSLIALASILIAPLSLLAGVWLIANSGSLFDLVHFYSGPNLDIVAGYSDAMALGPDSRPYLVILLFLYGLIVSLLLFLAFHLYRASSLPAIAASSRDLISRLVMMLFSLSFLSWVVFKASFVRSDPSHNVLGFVWLFCFLIVLVGFARRSLVEALMAPNGAFVGESLFIVFSLASVLSLLSGYRLSLDHASSFVSGFFRSFALLSGDGRAALRNNRIEAFARIRSSAEDFRLPDGASADIIPWDISSLLANRLRYSPRPIPQSYSAYSQELQRRNQAFFSNSSVFPDWLIVDIKDIDRRLPVGLDSSVLASLVRSYAFSHVGSRGSLVFRKRNPEYGFVSSHSDLYCSLSPTREMEWFQRGRLGWQTQSILIPRDSNGFVLLDVNLENSFSRTAQSILYRPSYVMLEYLDERGNVLDVYRFVPMAGLDMIIYPLIKTNQDFLQVLSGGRLSDGSASGVFHRQARSIRFATSNPMAPFSRSSFQLKAACLPR